MNDILNNKNILVTGGTKGLGLQIACKCIEQGANVCIIARSHKDIVAAKKEISLHQIYHDQKIIGYVHSITCNETMPKFFNRMMKFFDNRIDVLINNAGIGGSIGKFENIGKEWHNYETWSSAMETNFHGSARMARYALQYMIPQHCGKIIQLAGGGATSPRPHMTGYASSKTAIVRFMETLAIEVLEHNIDINCVSPGMMYTDMMQQLNYHIAKLSIAEQQKIKDFAVLHNQNNNNMNKALDLITFLASDKSNGITGKLISAQWDRWDLFSEHKDEIMNSDAYTLRRIVGKDCGFEWDNIG